MTLMLVQYSISQYSVSLFNSSYVSNELVFFLSFYLYVKGLKTGMYYLRSRAAADAIKFTVDTTMIKVLLIT